MRSKVTAVSKARTAMGNVLIHHQDYRERALRAIEILTKGKTHERMDSEELAIISLAYNWTGDHLKSYEAARLSLALAPNDIERVYQASKYARNAFCHQPERFLAACDSFILNKQGPPAYWHLCKAAELVYQATADPNCEDYCWDWESGDPIFFPDRIPLAAKELEEALRKHPGLQVDSSAAKWAGNWNQRWAAILAFPEFQHLAG